MLNFYRVMHYSAKRGPVITCPLYIFVFNFCTHFHHAKPRPGRGQSLEAEAEAEAKASRPRPKFWPRGQLGLEDLTSLTNRQTDKPTDGLGDNFVPTPAYTLYNVHRQRRG